MEQPGRKSGAGVVEQASLIEEMESSEAVWRVLAAGTLEGPLGTRMPRQNGEIGPGAMAQRAQPGTTALRPAGPSDRTAARRPKARTAPPARRKRRRRR